MGVPDAGFSPRPAEMEHSCHLGTGPCRPDFPQLPARGDACTDWRLLSATGPPQRSPHSSSPGRLGLPPVSTPKSQVTGQEVHGVLPDGEPRRPAPRLEVLLLPLLSLEVVVCFCPCICAGCPLCTGPRVCAWEAAALFLTFFWATWATWALRSPMEKATRPRQQTPDSRHRCHGREPLFLFGCSFL